MGIRTRRRSVTFSRTIRGSDNGISPGSDVTTSLTSNFSSWRDDGLPQRNFRALIKEGRSATTGLSGEMVTFQLSPPVNYKLTRNFLVSGSWKPWTNTFSGFPDGMYQIPDPSVPSISLTAAQAQATKIFYKKVKQASQSFQGLVWLGELREALRMLRSPMRAIRQSASDDYLKKVGRLKKRNPSNWKDGIAGAYLEWFYGWQPTISDINSALDTIDILSNDRLDRRQIRATGYTSGPKTVSTGTQDHDYGFSLRTRIVTQEIGKVVYRGLYKRRVSTSGANWSAQQMRGQLGLAMSDFVPAMWELLPWSFLFDYFTNIGDILETHFTSLEDVAWINKTTRTEKVQRRETAPDLGRMVQLANAVAWRRYERFEGVSQCYSVQKRVAFTRTAESPLPFTTLTFEIPGSPQKWIAMGALLAQANSIHPQRFSN